jgi:glycosyltransferase involved in cell wall biosynthesis
MEKIRLLRITTVPISLATLLRGQMRFFSQNNFEVLTASSTGPEVAQVESEGVRHVAIAMTRKITPFRDLIALWKIILLIRKFKPTIVHTHTPKAGLLGMLAAWICAVPVRMHTVAGIPWIQSNGARRMLLKWTERITYRCASCLYPNSNNLRQFLMRELSFDPDKVKVIGFGSTNGIDAEFFSRDSIQQEKADALRARFSIPMDDMVLCFIGRLVKDKGIVELVETFTQLKSEGKTWLILVGHRENDLDPLPETTLQKIKNNPHIIEVGYQFDVRPWLAASDIFVFPSHREGFPNVVMQAACMELPCIVTNINGCNEIIQDGLSGLVIPVKDVMALRNSIDIVMKQSDLGKGMGVRGREFVVSNFSQQVVWNELLQEYRSRLSSLKD